MIRDPFHYVDAVLIVPPVLVQCLELFDGEHTDLDLRATLVRLTGQLEVTEVAEHLQSMLSNAGFLDDENHARLKTAQHEKFAQAAERQAAHAGSAYPLEAGALRETLARYMNGDASPQPSLIGIAAPHVSPEAGSASYRAAYAALSPNYKDRTFVILGTSHYGEPERFGLTRKPYLTPLGEARTNQGMVERLMSDPALCRRLGEAARRELLEFPQRQPIRHLAAHRAGIGDPDPNVLGLEIGVHQRDRIVFARPLDPGPARLERVALRNGIADPEGQTIGSALRSLGYPSVSEVRSGKLMRIAFEADDPAAAEAAVDEMCRRLLANPVMEVASWELRADEQQDAEPAMPA